MLAAKQSSYAQLFHIYSLYNYFELIHNWLFDVTNTLYERYTIIITFQNIRNEPLTNYYSIIFLIILSATFSIKNTKKESIIILSIIYSYLIYNTLWIYFNNSKTLRTNTRYTNEVCVFQHQIPADHHLYTIKIDRRKDYISLATK